MEVQLQWIPLLSSLGLGMATIAFAYSLAVRIF